MILICTGCAWTQSKPAAPRRQLGFTAISEPHFIPASQADFLSPGDMLIGVAAGNSVKAYPAAILAQHGLVEDQMPDGPIAVTW